MKFGYRPDPPDSRDWLLHESDIAALPPVVSGTDVDWRDFDSPRIQRFGSCVGQSIAASCYLSMAVAGMPIAFPSATWAYAGARLLEAPKTALVDEGCTPRLAMMWCRERGLVAETRWPEAPETVCTIPPLDAFEEADSAELVAFYRIDPDLGVSGQLHDALRRGYCPIFAMTVDQKYADIGAAIYDAKGGSVLGGHMQTVVGYNAAIDAFCIRNTWGPDFGVNGYAWISSQFMDESTTDHYVIQASPQVR